MEHLVGLRVQTLCIVHTKWGPREGGKEERQMHAKVFWGEEKSFYHLLIFKKELNGIKLKGGFAHRDIQVVECKMLWQKGRFYCREQNEAWATKALHNNHQGTQLCQSCLAIGQHHILCWQLSAFLSHLQPHTCTHTMGQCSHTSSGNTLCHCQVSEDWKSAEIWRQQEEESFYCESQLFVVTVMHYSFV